MNILRYFFVVIILSTSALASLPHEISTTQELNIKNSSDSTIITSKIKYQNDMMSAVKSYLLQVCQASELKLLIGFNATNPASDTEWDFSGSSNGFTYSGIDTSELQRLNYGAKYVIPTADGDTLTRNDDADFTIGDNPATWFAWVKLKDVPSPLYSILIAKYTIDYVLPYDSHQTEWAIYFDLQESLKSAFVDNTHQDLSVYCINESPATQQAFAPIGEWHFVAVTFSGAPADRTTWCRNVIHYKDGAVMPIVYLYEFADADFTTQNTTSNITIGWLDSQYPPDLPTDNWNGGGIGAPVGFINGKALSAAEVLELYNLTKGFYRK